MPEPDRHLSASSTGPAPPTILVSARPKPDKPGVNPCRSEGKSTRPRGAAGVVLRRGRSLSLPELVTFLLEFDIATFKLPERLECFDTLPLSGFGKVSKKDLAARLAAS